MKRRILAICDLEALYACNFMEYVSRHKTIPFQIQAFTNVDKLLKVSKKISIEILLISDKAMNEEVAALDIEQIIILSEGICSPQLNKYPSVYKYQSSDNVIREVMAAYGEQHKGDGTIPMAKKPMDIIGIYSPLGRVLKTSFALTMGQELAKYQGVLYMNMEEYSGFEHMMGQHFEKNLSDLLYYVKQHQPGISYKIAEIVQTINNMDYIPPVISPQDIGSTTCKDWNYLIDEIDRNTSYEVLIMDIGDGVEDLFRTLDLCNVIYMPVLTDSISQGKVGQFENLLRLWDGPELLERIRKIKPPFHNQLGEGTQYVERLLWSHLGDYVRQLLKKEPL